MASYTITGGNKLNGSVMIHGNKNSVLPCLAACLLTGEQITLNNIPEISDVDVMVELLQKLGSIVEKGEHQIKVTTPQITSTTPPKELLTKLRASVLLAGPLLGRAGEVTFMHPGGDVIGRRGIDLHLKGFEKLGFNVQSDDLQYHVTKNGEQPSDVSMFLEIPTVTGTENLLLCAVLKTGTTTIRNAAQEPHVSDLCNLLVQMGATIKGIGSPTLKITGVDTLHGTEFTIGPDNIEFGTYAVAAAITKGEIVLENSKEIDLEPIAWPFRKMGVSIEPTENGYKVSAQALTAIPVLTANFWPGFPTDLMSVMIVLATQAEGVSLLRDYIYESRMFFTDKLMSMGANITIADPHRVLVYGPASLAARNQETPDIRAGMALVLSALIANGKSVINRAELIERGYDNVVENLRNLGAQIERQD